MRRICMILAIMVLMVSAGCSTRVLQSDEYEIASVLGIPGNSESSEDSSLPGANAHEYADALASFTTEFDPNIKGRTHNITLASNSINFIVVEPGEEFSYNNTIGPTTKQNGYELGMVFMQGKKAKGYGGGVCQVSSTLYNAAVNAGMDIVERHDHSLPVSYVPAGREAATSFGVKDFRFINTKHFPIVIKSVVDDGEITVSIHYN